MLNRRLLAFTLDLLMLMFGTLAGFLLAQFSLRSSNTIGGMGNVVVFAGFVAGGVIVALILLVGGVFVAGRSPGQRVMNVRYGESSKRSQRACHCGLAWLIPALLVAAPALALNSLSNYRVNLQRAYMDHTQARSESDKDQPEYNAKLIELEARLKRADVFAPEWLVGNDGLSWMLVLYGPLLIYWLTNIVLLRRPPYAAVHDRITGVRITKS